MKQRPLIILGAALGVGITNLGYAQSFNVNNNTTRQGIYFEFNAGGSGFPSGCTKTGGNPYCCGFDKTLKQASFSMSTGNFNIAVGKCGSSGSAQAEFNLGVTGVCGTHNKCDVVDGSIVQSSIPTVIIQPSSGPTINTSSGSCGVYYPGNQNCAQQQRGQKAKKCPANNFCTLNYYGTQTYTVTFQ